MRERHVPGAQMMKAPQHGHARPDTVTALDAHQTGYDPVPVCLLEFPARRHQAHLLGVLGRQTTHHVDLLEGELDGVEKLRLAGHVGRPELGADDAAAQTDQVGLPGRAPARVLREVDVEGKVPEARAAALLAQVPGEIVATASGGRVRLVKRVGKGRRKRGGVICDSLANIFVENNEHKVR